MKETKTAKFLSAVLVLVMFFQQTGFAQITLQTPVLTVNNTAGAEKFRQAHLRYFSFDANQDSFHLFMDKADMENISDSQLQQQTQESFKYFLTGVKLSNSKFWVNLKPDTADNLIDSVLEKTDIGKIFLASDVQLKKDLAMMTSPNTPQGREYWDKLYQKADEIFGASSNATIPTLIRPWIVPGEVIIRGGQEGAYIYKANLKVMLESDYLKNSDVFNFKDPRLKILNEYAAGLVKEMFIPQLTKEVNNSKKYSDLRKVFYSLILAQYFKEEFKGSTKSYYSQMIDSNNPDEITSKTSWSKEEYFKSYQKSFKEGEYNIKEPVRGNKIRMYVCGGISVTVIAWASDLIKPFRGIFSLSAFERNLNMMFQGFAADRRGVIVPLPVPAEEEIIDNRELFNKKIKPRVLNFALQGAGIQRINRLNEFDKKLKTIEFSAQQVIASEQLGEIVSYFVNLSKEINYYPENSGLLIPEQRKKWESLMVQKSILARELSGKLMEDYDKNREVLAALTQQADKMMESFLETEIANGNTKQSKAAATLKTARHFLNEWLEPQNNIPDYIVQGIYRGMLEGRSADLLYCFGSGWRMFGTAGIRNPAVQSSFAVIQEQELNEFAESAFTPVLTGPNLINVVTLLQQEAAIVRIMRDLKTKLERKDDSVKNLDKEFKKNVLNNRVTIAYDSRLNGEYFAKLLAAAFLRDGVNVDLFDNAAGVPHLAWAARREGSAFGILISASHSEANYNGFKAFLGHQMSQVDNENKNRIVNARSEVTYATMNLDLARENQVKEFGEINKIFGEYGILRWIGSDQRIEGKEYFNRELVSFYNWYYDLVRQRSPLALLSPDKQDIVEKIKRANPLRVLYTAFFGVGAIPAADYKGFLRESGYDNVDIVEAQTRVMDGRFPGHKAPDPGLVEGWVSNYFDYIIQYAGKDLKGIDGAILALNNIEVSEGTDPDIDRAAISLCLNITGGLRGNIKEALIDRIQRYINESGKVSKDKSDEIITQLRKNLDDKLLLTANDAWTFMAYWKLKMMEQNGALEKDRIYILEKSHVTTSALERVAQLYRQKGFQVYVVDTYVGFTEIGKKGRDLFKIAKLSWDIQRKLTNSLEVSDSLEELVRFLIEADAELKNNVPYQTAGLPIVSETINLLQEIIKGNAFVKDKALKNLNMLSRMHILLGVEESNGYGELGRWNRETETVELNHISDKDGSLAAFEFLEILSYGRSLKAITGGENKTGYDMYKELMADIGMVCTVNSALYHPGLGIEEKTNEIEGLEKIFAYVLQKMLEQGKEIKLFNGKYTVNKVEIFRDEKYDDFYQGFPEEGVRLYLTTRAGSEGIVTYRPSGTGDSNRVYSWLLGKRPQAGENLEAYRQNIEDEMSIMVRDFYGIENQEQGYMILSNDKFYGLLIALKEGKLSRQVEVFNKALAGSGSADLNQDEKRLYDAVVAFSFAKRKGNADEKNIQAARDENRKAWEAYLSNPEVQAIPQKLNFIIDGQIKAEVPRAALISWQAGLLDYFVGLIEENPEAKKVSFSDPEICVLLKKRIFGIEVTTIDEDAVNSKQRERVEERKKFISDSALESLGRSVDEQLFTEYKINDLLDKKIGDIYMKNISVISILSLALPKMGKEFSLQNNIILGEFLIRNMGKSYLNYNYTFRELIEAACMNYLIENKLAVTDTLLTKVIDWTIKENPGFKLKSSIEQLLPKIREIAGNKKLEELNLDDIALADDGGNNKKTVQDRGGIDFTRIDILRQSLMGNSGMYFGLPQASVLQNVNLALENQQLKKLMNIGVLASTSRVIKYLSASIYKSEETEIDNAFVYLLGHFKLEEELCVNTDSKLKDFLSFFEAGA